VPVAAIVGLERAAAAPYERGTRPLYHPRRPWRSWPETDDATSVCAASPPSILSSTYRTITCTPHRPRSTRWQQAYLRS